MALGTILIVEDNDLNKELVTAILTRGGFTVLHEYDAEKGIERARASKPTAILMDIALPGMDGLEATRILKADPATKNIPIIALTAHAMRGDEEKARLAGCDGYVTKPIDTRTFSEVVANIVRRHAERA